MLDKERMDVSCWTTGFDPGCHRSAHWGSIGLFQFDIVAWAFGGAGSAVSRVIYTLVALAGIWCISLFFRDREEILEHND